MKITPVVERFVVHVTTWFYDSHVDLSWLGLKHNDFLYARKKLEQAAPAQQLHSSHNKITLEQFLKKKKKLKEDHFANSRPTSPLQVVQFRMICEMVIVVQFMYDGYSIVQRRENFT